MFWTQLKTSESQYSVLMPDDAASAAVCCYAAANGASTPLPPLLYNSPPNNRFGDTNKTNLNGSIITLTMKNNHLIVETEERVPVINYAVQQFILLLFFIVMIIPIKYCILGAYIIMTTSLCHYYNPYTGVLLTCR